MRIRTADLRAITMQILDHLESGGRDAVEVDADFYWNIPAQAKYDQYEEPENLDVGQLSEDWERLEAILRGQSPPVAAAAAWLGEVMKAVAKHAV